MSDLNPLIVEWMHRALRRGSQDPSGGPLSEVVARVAQEIRDEAVKERDERIVELEASFKRVNESLQSYSEKMNDLYAERHEARARLQVAEGLIRKIEPEEGVIGGVTVSWRFVINLPVEEIAADEAALLARLTEEET